MGKSVRRAPAHVQLGDDLEVAVVVLLLLSSKASTVAVVLEVMVLFAPTLFVIIAVVPSDDDEPPRISIGECGRESRGVVAVGCRRTFVVAILLDGGEEAEETTSTW